ncbi:radical SAM protein [Limisalsivibrio acetivorans]|uniref:radical SAM protein n=1 Tax=Limisalsivibrio acetivorans TaxID=1304888 RepID=UPI0003B6B25E|nr:radical SAM protein [Limisalsivibrio acetivorans]
MFEQGPIRPPSEAESLFIRVVRNCPWNACAFCPVYKGEKFSRRSFADIKSDIDNVNRMLPAAAVAHEEGSLRATLKTLKEADKHPFYAACNWLSGGMKSVFLQDADSLNANPELLEDVLRYLKETFETIERITAYARSRSAAKSKHMKSFADAGLNRIHIGMETGSDKILAHMNKGCNKQHHINGVGNAKDAGMQVSLYWMPGLGGLKDSMENAAESADVINKSTPDFVRLRTAAVPPDTPLEEMAKGGEYTRPSDEAIVREIRKFIEECRSYFILKSDHILNLLPEIEGTMPDDKQDILESIDRFLNAPEDLRQTYIIARRLGIVSGFASMKDPLIHQNAKQSAQQALSQYPDFDSLSRELVKRFI